MFPSKNPIIYLFTISVYADDEHNDYKRKQRYVIHITAFIKSYQEGGISEEQLSKNFYEIGKINVFGRVNQ